MKTTLNPNKLVRDKIPEIIGRDGGVAKIHIADEEEFAQKLKEKLSEEVAEYLRDKTAEELADILEVVYALANLQNISPRQLEELRKEKAEKRGSFTKKIVLEES